MSLTKTQGLSQTQKQQLLSQIVAVAQSQIGVEEVPRGSNSGTKVKAYLAAVGIKTPASWCMAFACYCVLAALAKLGLARTAMTLILTGYCPSQVNHARGLGTLISAADVATGKAKCLPGYLMVVNIPSEGGYHHTGVVVVAPDATGAYQTVEGNTNHSGASQGYAVMTQHRNLHDTASDGSAKYAFIMTC